MQFFAGSPRMWRRSLYPADTAKEFRRRVSELDLGPVFIHALYLTNLASDEYDLRRKTKLAMVTDLQNAVQIGAAGVVLHIGSHQGRGFETTKELVLAEMQEILRDTPVGSMLLLENAAGQKGKIGSLDELRFFLDQLPADRVGVCLDTAHAFEAGLDFRTPQALDDFIDQVNRIVSWARVRLIHLNDSRTRFDSRHDVHENLGQGEIGLETLRLLVNHPLITPLPLVLEVPGFDGDGPDRESIQVARELVQAESN